jgi:hypothetical protein
MYIKKMVTNKGKEGKNIGEITLVNSTRYTMRKR